MTIRRVLVGGLLVLLAIGATASPAYAGAPTFVLMVNHESGRAVGASYRDPAYREFFDAVGHGFRGPLDQPASIGTNGSAAVSLVWLCSESVCRIDRVHVTSNDGVWVETEVDLGDGSGVRGRWHRPASPDTLLAALAAAGLVGDGGPAGGTAPSAESPPLSETASPEAAPPAEASAAMPAVAGLAAVGGLVLGGLLVSGWTRRRT